MRFGLISGITYVVWVSWVLCHVLSWLVSSCGMLFICVMTFCRISFISSVAFSLSLKYIFRKLVKNQRVECRNSYHNYIRVMVIGVILGCVLIPRSGKLSFGTWVNTDENWLFSISALDLASLYISPSVFSEGPHRCCRTFGCWYSSKIVLVVVGGLARWYLWCSYGMNFYIPPVGSSPTS